MTVQASETKKPVLLILHQEHSTPGRAGTALTRLGYPLDIRRPRFGDELPKTMADHSGAIIFGGPQSANDEEEFIKQEIDWINVPLAESKPYLGICLGAQMMARTLGARVFCHVDQRAEVGYYPIRPTAEGLAMNETWPCHVYQWHREGFDLPPGAVMLAEGDEHFPVQAMRYGPAAFAIQFHPEVSHLMMCRWTIRGAARFELPGAKGRDQHFADRPVYDFAIRQWFMSFLDHWLHSGDKVEAPSRRAQRAIEGFEGAMAAAAE
ncbi:glutamine amidotransferase [Variibacter gotjawalensis]|uniref:Glutamine amidotransferase n=1 Tax=Variibacter gotjawalensis TaxID=1333996 RepID=A0A0S3PPE7_9BRAD|nr:glutamine amidotransferase [Variibacter gotjawalensis]NIK48123.1 GMP synthase (glutamine-hydrolysing) [Variibacter gotjawalensis]RZS49999.1 GMP synthase (glutamine-hydrolysing) [Variibacter gotjawalensis]BAT57826.1 glutamine amidotransferase [Variibacter gotjawalensis]